MSRLQTTFDIISYHDHIIHTIHTINLSCLNKKIPSKICFYLMIYNQTSISMGGMVGNFFSYIILVENPVKLQRIYEYCHIEDRIIEVPRNIL